MTRRLRTVELARLIIELSKTQASAVDLVTHRSRGGDS